MLNDKITKLLAELQAEGLKVMLEPESVRLNVGKLEVTCPHSPGRVDHRETKITLEGQPITHRLVSIDVHLAVNEVNSATIVLGIIP